MPAPGRADDHVEPWEIQEEGDDDADETKQEKDENRGCGLATKQFPKITGGRPADPAEWPWMAALITNPPTTAFCGGVLITDRHVLTAGQYNISLKAQKSLLFNQIYCSSYSTLYKSNQNTKFIRSFGRI